MSFCMLCAQFTLKAVQSHQKWMWTLTSWHRFNRLQYMHRWIELFCLEQVNKSKTKTSEKWVRKEQMKKNTHACICHTHQVISDHSWFLMHHERREKKPTNQQQYEFDHQCIATMKYSSRHYHHVTLLSNMVLLPYNGINRLTGYCFFFVLVPGLLLTLFTVCIYNVYAYLFCMRTNARREIVLLYTGLQFSRKYVYLHNWF